MYISALKNLLKKVTGWIYETSGIEIPNHLISLEQYQNVRGFKTIEGRLGFHGPLKRKTNLQRVKLDFTVQEKVVLNSEERSIFHSYSDNDIVNITATCYCLEELFAEKIRALAERARPRDLYDVIHLYKLRDNIDKSKLFLVLKEKCSFKNILLPTMRSIQLQESILVSNWEHTLSHQLSKLDSFISFWDVLPNFFNWLYE